MRHSKPRIPAVGSISAFAATLMYLIASSTSMIAQDVRPPATPQEALKPLVANYEKLLSTANHAPAKINVAMWTSVREGATALK